MANHSANHSYLKDRLGFDPDELMNEVDELFNNGPDDNDFESPSHKKFKTFQPSPSSSTSSMSRSFRDSYENTLSNIKGNERKANQSADCESVNYASFIFGGKNVPIIIHNCITGGRRITLRAMKVTQRFINQIVDLDTTKCI